MMILPHLNPQCRGKVTLVAMGQWAMATGRGWLARTISAVEVARWR